jgi:hypothetical protein
MIGHSTLQKAQRILSSKLISNRLLLAIMTIIIISIIVDTSFLKLYDLTPSWQNQELVFTCISAVFIISQIFVLSHIRQQNMRFVRTKQFKVINYIVTVAQWVLTIIVLYVIFQIWFESSFDATSIIVGISISYSLGMIMTGYLSYRFFIWLKSNHGIKILMYLLSSALITTSSFFTLIFLDSVLSLYTEVAPRITGTGQYLSAFQNTSLMLANVFAIMSFVVTWFATAVLLGYRSRRIGRIKYWIIIALPLIYFLSQFISSITDEFAPLISSDPVTFAIVLTLIFTLSKLAGGILFGFAFWSIAKTINDEFVVPKNLIKLAGFGYVILFMSTQTVAFSIVPYPPFGLITILFYGLSSYMILVGVYFSVIIISQDSKLRSTVKKITENQPTLLSDISYAQLEEIIEKRAMILAQSLDMKSQIPIYVTKDIDAVHMRNYAMSVIDELRSFDPFFSRVMEKEKELISNSKLILACINSKLLELIRDDQFTLISEITYKHRRGGHGGIRLITSINDQPSATVAEELLAIGVEVKHIANLHSIQFVVSDREVLEIIHEENRLLVERDSSQVHYYLNIFEDLWKHGKDARKRILELKTADS